MTHFSLILFTRLNLPLLREFMRVNPSENLVRKKHCFIDILFKIQMWVYIKVGRLFNLFINIRHNGIVVRTPNVTVPVLVEPRQVIDAIQQLLPDGAAHTSAPHSTN